jgi:hypothetical protein
MVILFFLWVFSTAPFHGGEDLVERPERHFWFPFWFTSFLE